MQVQDFKRIGRTLKELYALLKQEILDEGIDLMSPEYDTLLSIGQEKIREIVLAREGFTIEEYREAKAQVEAEKTKPLADLKAEVEVIKQAEPVKVPTPEEIADIAKGVIPAPQITQQTINKIVRETIVEKPTVIRETVIQNTIEQVDTSDLERRMAGIVERVEAMPAPEVHNHFAENFEKNTEILNMPDFRRLAMGLQGQIDELRDALGGGGAVDSVNSQTGVVILDAADVGAVASVVAGTGISVDSTDPQNPVVSATGGAATEWGDITGALSDQTDLQSALDGKVDENAAITGATKTKITYDAKGLVTAGADATTADIADSTNKRYVTDADLVDIGNLLGTNTGDQTSIVGITGTKAQFDTAVTDGNFLYVGDVVSGYTVETPSGTVDGSNATFTVSAVPVYIVVDGITLFDGAGYTIATLTLTLDNAPQQFIRSFH